MEFIALLSSGKGTWGQVAGLVNKGNWEKKIFIVPPFFKTSAKEFDFTKNCDIIEIDFDKDITEIIKNLKENLKNKIQGVEVALSIASGTGKEHMALISALLQLPVGVKFVILTKNGLIEL